jgi:hypothetical protein
MKMKEEQSWNGTTKHILMGMTLCHNAKCTISNLVLGKLAKQGRAKVSEPVPYPGREEVWPGLGIYIHPVVQQVPGWIGRRERADWVKSDSRNRKELSRSSRLEMTRYSS